ncbi:helix-turn-helix domain-containing protein [Noviherbaspirillum pedocola]|uniref:Helix-turn-helix domain-containing protein n=1 Tax=Noviherbaspirillum pedocola TaxID=2801341 RepID=A0A934SYC4_9BURK|nr:helix-turn-helix domain-containing protein [Noviherbaspirillum pedocola]MBK4737929.1 helix-turn-helix domain-containing protein [Noviherbaspirillum pedocola]
MQMLTQDHNKTLASNAANDEKRGGRFSLGEFLRNTRRSMKGPTGRPMSIADITRRSALSLPVLSKLEAGKIENPRFTTMIEVSRGYGLPFDTLAGFFESRAAAARAAQAAQAAEAN